MKDKICIVGAGPSASLIGRLYIEAHKLDKEVELIEPIEAIKTTLKDFDRTRMQIITPPDMDLMGFNPPMTRAERRKQERKNRK